jgi:hypothetical protein
MRHDAIGRDRVNVRANAPLWPLLKFFNSID